MFNKIFIRSIVLLILYSAIIFISIPIAILFIGKINNIVFTILIYITYAALVIIYITIIYYLFFKTPTHIIISKDILYFQMLIGKTLIKKSKIKSYFFDNNDNIVIEYSYDNIVKKYTVILITKKINNDILDFLKSNDSLLIKQKNCS